MSQENVEIVKRAGEAFNRHDAEALAAMSDDDLEFVSALAAVETGGIAYRGPNAWGPTSRGWTKCGMAGASKTWRSSMPMVIASSRHFASSARARPAAPLSITGSVLRTGSATGSSGECALTSTPPTPSKPWGCRSRRCRR